KVRPDPGGVRNGHSDLQLAGRDRQHPEGRDSRRSEGDDSRRQPGQAAETLRLPGLGVSECSLPRKDWLATRSSCCERGRSSFALRSEPEASRMVRKGGLEPPRYCYRQPLKLVRLPIPPLPRGGQAPLKRCPTNT